MTDRVRFQRSTSRAVAVAGAALLLLPLTLLPAGSNPASPTNAQLAAHASAILNANCEPCHGDKGPLRRKAFIAADSWNSLVHVAKLVVPGHPEKSRIFERITSIRNPMPPKQSNKHLSASDIAAIKLWIQRDAPAWSSHKS